MQDNFLQCPQHVQSTMDEVCIDAACKARGLYCARCINERHMDCITISFVQFRERLREGQEKIWQLYLPPLQQIERRHAAVLDDIEDQMEQLRLHKKRIERHFVAKHSFLKREVERSQRILGELYAQLLQGQGTAQQKQSTVQRLLKIVSFTMEQSDSLPHYGQMIVNDFERCKVQLDIYAQELAVHELKCSARQYSELKLLSSSELEAQSAFVDTNCCAPFQVQNIVTTKELQRFYSEEDKSSQIQYISHFTNTEQHKQVYLNTRQEEVEQEQQQQQQQPRAIILTTDASLLSNIRASDLAAVSERQDNSGVAHLQFQQEPLHISTYQHLLNVLRAECTLSNGTRAQFTIEQIYINLLDNSRDFRTSLAALAEWNVLKKLRWSIRGHSFSEQEVEQFATWLGGQNKVYIIVLSFKDCRMSDRSANTIFEALQKLKNINCLGLRLKNLKVEGTNQLFLPELVLATVKNLPNLHTLQIAADWQLDYQAFKKQYPHIKLTQ